jgi:hypothetical protein
MLRGLEQVTVGGIDVDADQHGLVGLEYLVMSLDPDIACRSVCG